MYFRHVRKFDVINGGSIFWAPCAVDWLLLKTDLVNQKRLCHYFDLDFIVYFFVYYTGAGGSR